MEFQDRMLKCVDCGSDFVFTAGEQIILPRQTIPQRTQTLQNMQSETGFCPGIAALPPGHARVETHAVCSQCGKETTVPFRPTQGRPILCRECFRERRHAASA